MGTLVRIGIGVGALAIALGPAPSSAQERPRPSLDFLDVPDRPHAEAARVDAARAGGLEAIEAELPRLSASARAYRLSIDQIVLRRLRARRRALSARYDRSLRIERGLEEQARERAMAELTAFIARYPDAGDRTADALLRLAELHVLRALDAVDRDEVDRPDFTAAIALARRLAREQPRYRHVDRGLYLLGYALSEMDRPDEALSAWRALACPSRFSLDAARDAIARAEPAPLHPAFGAEARRGPPSIGEDPYAGCVAAPSELRSEVWLRIGEHHFEGSLDQLAAAMSAYRRVASDPSDPLYSFGLYKLAWSHYRASRFAEAVEHFGRLVAYSDARRSATGRAGSDLRAEALQYIAITLAYEDWNEDGAVDSSQGMPSTLGRATDRALLPDAPWAAEAARHLGDVLYEEARYDEAIAAWREALARAPASCDAPDVVLAIARAHRRLDRDDAAFEAVAEITDLADRPDAWSSCEPAQVARIERIAERALASTAAYHHQRAQALRAREDGAAANAQYARAARAYQAFLARFGNTRAAYEMRYDLAEALYWSGRYAEAAAAYQAVLESNQDDRLLARAARRVVESHARAMELEVEHGALALREEPPALDDDGSMTPEAIPLALQRVMRAREIYVRWVPRDAERVRDAYAFNNASMLYRYGFLPEARERFTRLLESRCRGASASRAGYDAFLALVEMADARGDLDERLRLTGVARSCSFDPSGPAIGELSGAESPFPELPDLEADTVFALLSREAEQLGSIAGEAERRQRAESIAARFVAAVDRAPNNPEAPHALAAAGRLFLEEAGHPAAAERVYRRIVDDAPAVLAAQPERRAELDRVVAAAHYGLARTARRTFEIDRALAQYAAVTDSERFARSDDEAIRELRRSALRDAASLASAAGLHARAADAWARAGRELPASEAREASLRAAEERLAAGDARTAARELDAWIRAHAASDALTVRAHARRAEAARRAGDRAARERELEETLRAHRAVDRPDGGSMEHAARAALALADLRAEAHAPARIRVAPQADVPSTIAALQRQVRDESARYRALLDAYDAAVAIGRADTSVAALRRQGALYEELVRTILESEIETPRDVARAIARAPASSRAALRAQLAAAFQDTLDELVRPVECRAVERYVLSARLARRSSLSTEDADAARERLIAYGEERVSDCLREALARDPTFDGYRPGELDRARPGLVSPPGDDTAPPALDR